MSIDILKRLQLELTSFKKIDKENLKYLKSEYSKLKNLSLLKLKVTDFDGNSTHNHNLDLEALIAIFHIYIEQQKQLMKDPWIIKVKSGNSFGDLIVEYFNRATSESITERFSEGEHHESIKLLNRLNKES